MEPIHITADTQRITSRNEIRVTQHDSSVSFVLKIQQNGKDVPLPTDNVYALTSLRLDNVAVVSPNLGLVTGINEVTFHLGAKELEVQGLVRASVQIINPEGRLSTLSFNYSVVKDLSNTPPTENEKTLIEIVLNEGPSVIEEAKRSSERAEQAAMNIDQSIVAATEIVNLGTEMFEEVGTLKESTEKVKQETELVKSETLTVKQTAEKTIEDTLATKVATEKVKKDTEVVKEATEQLRAGMQGELTTVKTQLADKAKKIDFDANEYGADPSASWTVNRDAFQAANNAASTNGGGRVVAKPGLYIVKGIIQDSNVEFYLPQVTFKNPDGIAPDVITNRKFQTTGTAVGNTLTVSDASNFQVGSIVVVQSAGGILDTQFSALSGDINATTTTITIAANGGYFPRSGYMQVNNEIIKYTSISGTSLLGVVRGVLGTTAANHKAGDFIGVARHFYGEVTNKNDNIITLKYPVATDVVDTIIETGVLFPKITGVTIDANKINGGYAASVYGASWVTSRWGIMKDVTILRGDMGGLFLGQGTSECTVETLNLKDCGGGTILKGSGLWLFQGCARNRINNLFITGDSWAGVYFDDRTTIGEPYDAPNYDNYVTNFVIDTVRPPTGYPTAIAIVGSSRNKFINGFVRGSVTGISIDEGGQYQTANGSKAKVEGNEIVGVDFDVNQPWIIHGKGNRLHDCSYSAMANSTPIVSAGNLTYAVTTVKGQPIDTLMDVKFKSGSIGAPGISFTEDTDTGFYQDAANVMHMTLGGVKVLSFYGTELRIADGVRLATGTTDGTRFPFLPTQKIGFYGKTPITQPPAITNTTDSDLATLEAELNKVKTTLRNLGLIAT